MNNLWLNKRYIKHNHNAAAASQLASIDNDLQSCMYVCDTVLSIFSFKTWKTTPLLSCHAFLLNIEVASKIDWIGLI